MSVNDGVEPYTFFDKNITCNALYYISTDNTSIKINNIHICKAAEYKGEGDVDDPHKATVEDESNKSFSA